MQRVSSNYYIDCILEGGIAEASLEEAERAIQAKAILHQALKAMYGIVGTAGIQPLDLLQVRPVHQTCDHTEDPRRKKRYRVLLRLPEFAVTAVCGALPLLSQYQELPVSIRVRQCTPHLASLALPQREE